MLQQRQIIANSNFAINLTILPDIQNESNPTNIKFLTYHGLAFIHGITDQYSVGAERSHVADPDVEGLKQKRRHNLNFPPFLTNNNRAEKADATGAWRGTTTIKFVLFEKRCPKFQIQN